MLVYFRGPVNMKLLLVFLLVLATVQSVQCVVYGLLLSITANDGRGETVNASNSTSHDAIKRNSFVCKKDKHCGKGKYCHRFYGTCHDHKSLGAHCRRDHVCSQGMECVFGKCRKMVQQGQESARCAADRECNADLCCAPTHGEWLCKKMLRDNDICSVPEGGLAFRINHSCPCGQGFACKKVRTHGKKRILRLFRKLRRCVRIT